MTEVQRKRADTVNHEASSNKVYKDCCRSRSSSLFLKLLEHDTNDNIDQFQIPNTTSVSYAEKRSRSNTLIEDLDLSLYKDVEINKAPETTMKTSPANEVGLLSGYVTYFSEQQSLLVKCERLVINHRPFENSLIIDNDERNRETFSLELSSNVSQNNTRKISVFKSQSRQAFDVNLNEAIEMPFKSKNPQNYSLKITVYPYKMRTDDLAIGFVTLSLINVVEAANEECLLNEKILSYIKSSTTVKYGELTTLLTWNDKAQVLDLQIQKIEQTFNDRVLWKEKPEFTSDPQRSVDATIKFEQKYHVEMTHKQVLKMTISLQVYQKHMFTNIQLNRINIGPYMLPTTADSKLSCWEKLLIYPNTTLNFCGDIYT